MVKNYSFVNNYLMNKFLFIIQLLIKAFLIFLIFFVWLKFFVYKLWVVIIISLICTFVILCFSTLLLTKNQKKKYLKQKEKEDAQDMFFSIANDRSYLTFYEELCKLRHSNTKKKKKYLLITHQDSSKTILYPINKYKEVSIDDIKTIFLETEKEQANKIVICCNEYDKKLISFIKNYSIEISILDKYDTYMMLYQEYDYYPKITMRTTETKKLTFKELISYSFNRSRAKGYLIASLFIFLTSFFVKISLYYCIFSSLLLLLALISYINPKCNINTKKEII